MPRLIKLEDLSSLKDLIVKKLDLRPEQEALVDLLDENRPVDALASFSIARASFENAKKIPTDLDGVDATLTAAAQTELELKLYPESSEVVLGEFEFPQLHRSRRVYAVPDGRSACGVELRGEMGVGASGGGGTGWKFAISAAAEASAGFRFFKEMQGTTGSRDLIVETFRSLKTPFHAVSHPPEEGEILVVDYHGLLKLGAGLEGGWNLSGSKKISTDLDDIDLVPEYDAEAMLGVTAGITLERDVLVIVRPTGEDGWVNVCLHKVRDREASLAANLSVDARLDSTARKDGETADVGIFVDALLNRTPVPRLIAEIGRFDTSEEMDDNVLRKLREAKDKVVGRITDEIRGALEGHVQDLDRLLDEVRQEATKLVDSYSEIEADVQGFITRAVEKVGDLTEIDGAVARIAEAENADALLDLLAQDDTDRIRKVLGIAAKALDIDLGATSWLDSKLPELRALLERYEALDDSVRDAFEEKYRWLKSQLHIEAVVAKIEAVANNELSIQDLLDEKILWLNQYLGERLGKPIDELGQHLDAVAEHLGKLVSGYDNVVTKAKDALESALNFELGLQVGLAWNRVSHQQALVSVDLNLNLAAGREAMRDVLRGDFRDVMVDRLTNADAIRMRKSFFLDELRGSTSIKTVINGRESMRVGSWLVSQRAVLEPTENGEVWVQESSAESRFRRSRKRSMLNISTMFQVSMQQHFVRAGRALEGQPLEVGGYEVRYNYREEIEGDNLQAAAVIARLEDLHRSMTMQPVSEDRYRALLADLETLGEFGPLGSVSIDARLALDADALLELFRENATDEIRSLARDAWDKAALSVFADHPRVVSFYRTVMDDPENASDATSARWGMNLSEQLVCGNLANSRVSFPQALSRLHRVVFVKFNDRELPKKLKVLAKRMGWVNRIELGGERDLAFNVFACLVDESEREGGLAVGYTHPLTGEAMQLRVDSEEV